PLCCFSNLSQIPFQSPPNPSPIPNSDLAAVQIEAPCCTKPWREHYGDRCCKCVFSNPLHSLSSYHKTELGTSPSNIHELKISKGDRY
uniref:Uncharacterized protein n=1 Tax=Leersia perrieri TaxID=77586 RepID=A0A0D9WX11_9ORYZ